VSRPWRDRLKTAAELLRTASDDKAGQGDEKAASAYADAARDVEAVLAPGGWNWLRETEATQSEMVSMGLTMDKRLKNALSAAAENTGTVPSAAVVKGYQAFLEGRFVPPRVQSTRGSAGYSKTTLTVTFPKSLQAEVRARIPQVEEAEGYRITLSSIAIEWLMDELGVERPLD
jgi:regulator of protease activity HflC (stomatin/prohibitin superfamily)